MTNTKTIPIDQYRKAHASTVIPASVRGASNTLSGSGRDANISSDVYYRKAKSFLFGSDMLFNIEAPHINLNSQHALIQSKNYNLKTHDTQISCINSWIRAQNINVNQSGYYYNYAEQESRNAAPLYLNQSSKAYHYSDYMKLQVGQLSLLPLSSLSLGNNYGKLEIGAVNNLSLESKRGSVTFNSAKSLSFFCNDVIKFKGLGLSFSSLSGGLIKSAGELAFANTGPLLFSSDSVMSLNTKGPMYIDAAVVIIGSSGFFKGVVDLDSNIVSSVTESVGFDAVSNISSLTGAVTSQVTSALGVFSPGNLQNYIFSALEPDNLVGNILGGAIDQQLGGFGDFIGSLMPSNPLAPILPVGLDSISPFHSTNFVYSTFPPIKPIEPYSSTSINKPTSSSSMGGISIPPINVKEDNDV